MFPTLDFPPINRKYKKVNENVYILDRIRKKFILLTPEEWVRQHLVEFLIMSKQFPSSLIRVEGGLRYNKLLKRSDVLIFDRAGNPLLIFECKSADHALGQADIAQVSAYGSSLKPGFLGLTNGLRHFIWQVNYATKSTGMIDGFPDYETLLLKKDG